MRKQSRGARVSRLIDVSEPERITSEFIERLTKLCLENKGEFSYSYLNDSFLSKFVSKDTDPSSVRRQRAINKWLAVERDNEATTVRLLTTPDGFNILPRVKFSRFVDWTRLLIERTIGATVPIEALIGSFSGGASTSRIRSRAHPSAKYVGQADATIDAKNLFLDLIRGRSVSGQWLGEGDIVEDEIPGWDISPERINVVEGNILFTVPKKTDIDRVACKEPDINMWIQKGVGSFIRSSLRRVGIDLNDQSVNRELARRGSRDGRLATLDLSSASDSVTTELVSLLLPPCWFSVMMAVRSPVTLIDGVPHRNEMISSMGNGFTFELESLLFWALTKAVAYFCGCPGVISVYGDDIICPSEIAPLLTFVLGYFGFSVNEEKSFYTGTFRESCGGHFENGLDVTPFYLRKPINDVTDVILLANALTRWAGQDGYLPICDPRPYELWAWLRSLVPSCLWGGQDTSSRYSLVTGDLPRLRLRPLNKVVKTGLGGYIHWLNSTWTRMVNRGEPVVTSEHTVVQTSYRLISNCETVNGHLVAFWQQDAADGRILEESEISPPG